MYSLYVLVVTTSTTNTTNTLLYKSGSPCAATRVTR